MWLGLAHIFRKPPAGYDSQGVREGREGKGREEGEGGCRPDSPRRPYVRPRRGAGVLASGAPGPSVGGERMGKGDFRSGT